MVIVLHVVGRRSIMGFAILMLCVTRSRTGNTNVRVEINEFLCYLNSDQMNVFCKKLVFPLVNHK